MHIGNKSTKEWARLARDPSSYAALLRMFKVHVRPVRALYDQVAPGRRFPATFAMRTPIGAVDIKLFHVADISTLNLVFSRQDYVCPADAKVVVDIGANIGVAATFFLTRNRGAFAYLFEPAPQILPRLRENMRQFAGRCDIRNVAIAADDGEFPFQTDETGRYGRIVGDGPGGDVTVRATSINRALGAIVERHGAIDCLKIDVEGMERRLCDALAPELWPKIRVLNVESPERFPSIPAFFEGDARGSARRFRNVAFEFKRAALA